MSKLQRLKRRNFARELSPEDKDSIIKEHMAEIGQKGGLVSKEKGTDYKALSQKGVEARKKKQEEQKKEA